MDVSSTGAVAGFYATPPLASVPRATTPITPAAGTGVSAAAPASSQAPGSSGISPSTIVELSSLGLFSAAIAYLGDNLQAAQANLAFAVPASLLAATQSADAAYNVFQQNIGSLESLFATNPSLALAEQFQLSLNALSTTDLGSGTTPFASLLIDSLLVAPSSTAATDTANIANTAAAAIPTAVSADALTSANLAATALETAIATNPGQAQTLLAQTTQALATQAAAFETQIAVPATLTADAALLTAAAVLPAGQTTTLTPDLLLLQTGLANAATAINSTSPIDNLLATAVPTVPAPAAASPPAASQVPAATPAATAASQPVQASQVASALAVTQASTQTQAATPPPTGSDATAADQAAARAAQALQELLSDPLSQARNLVLTPLYAALIANTHQGDFVAPAQAAIRPPAAGESPAPVSAASRSRSIAYYTTPIETEAQRLQGVFA